MDTAKLFNNLCNLCPGVSGDAASGTPTLGDLRIARLSTDDVRASRFAGEFECLTDEEIAKAIAPMTCYQLRCRPLESLLLAYLHFRDLRSIQAISIAAMAQGATAGKIAPCAIASPSHWNLTVWGAQYSELRGDDAIWYGGRLKG